MNIYQMKDKIIHKKIMICIIFVMITLITILSLPIKATAATSDFDIKGGVLVKYLGDSKNVVIPNTVKSIGTSAFSEQNKIQSIKIPSSVTSIGDMAFLRCTSLKNINIPKKVTYIGESAFAYCSSLKSITIPELVTSISKSTFSDCSKLASVKFNGKVTLIGDYAFAYCDSLKNITIPNTVTSIGAWAFTGCGFEGISLPNKIIAIEEATFSACLNLASVKIPNKVIRLGDNVFSDCRNLKKVTIPSSVISLGDGVFGCCSGLTSITIPNSVTVIGNGTFSECTRLVNVSLPNSIKFIPTNTFMYCSSLVKFTIPASVTCIKEYSFSSCTSLTDITLSKNITDIDPFAFSECSSLKAINLPNSVKKIGDNAFFGCSSLTSVNIPSSVKEIGVGTFSTTPWYEALTRKNPLFILNNILFDAENCRGIITVPKGVTEINPSAFQHSKVTEVILQEGLTKIGEYAFATSTLKKITLPDGLIEIGQRAFEGTKITAIQLPDSLISISAYTFYECKNLESIDIPDKVTSIGMQAFANCISMKKVTIPKSVTLIGINAFYRNNKLTNIQVSAENPNYTGDGIFLLNRDKTVLIECAKATGEITVPEGVEKIADGVFSSFFDPDYDITKVTFPSTLKELGNNVFDMCYDLEEINIPSSLGTFVQKFEYCAKLIKINVFEANNKINYISDNGILYNADKTTLICNPCFGSVVVLDGVTSIADYAFPNATISVTIPRSVTSLGETVLDTEWLWRSENETPFYVYGYVGTIAEKYCKDHLISFLAYDGTYTITYHLDGGINNLKNPVSFQYQSASIELQNPVKAGYKFLYWYKDISICEDGCCRGEEIVSIIPEKSMGDIELIAKWEPNKMN